MLKIAFGSLLAAALVATTFASPSDAAEHRKHVKQVEVARDRAAPGYGMPANYYPAPPFPFFLLPVRGGCRPILEFGPVTTRELEIGRRCAADFPKGRSKWISIRWSVI
jgi:hypothetical protein